MPVPPTAPAKQEFLVINIGSGVQEGSSATVLGVVESIEAGKEIIRKIRGTASGKIVIAEKKTVVTRVPVVELQESDESVLVNPK
jgi:hypothetical protein